MKRCITVLALTLLVSLAWGTKMEPPATTDPLEARLKKLETELSEPVVAAAAAAPAAKVDLGNVKKELRAILKMLS